MLKKLGESLRKITNKISNSIFVDKDLLDSVIRDLQRALIEADVNVSLVKEVSDKIRKQSLEEKTKGLDKKEHLIKILHDEMILILGDSKKLKLESKQNKILFIGLYGTGKTTTIAKLGNYFSKRGKKVALVGLDVHRPAAKEQLKQLGEENKLKVFVNEENDAVKSWKKISKDLKSFDLVLIDSAGRHTLDKELISEIKDLKKKINPSDVILVISADIGQSARKQAKEFKEALDISGIIITKMDSSAKAGGALSACKEVKAPIFFITNGEKINDIEEFSPEAFLSRLLGMGDLETLLEKVRSVSEEKEQKKLKKKLEKGKMDLNDFVDQSGSINSLGGFEKIKNFIPGVSKMKIKDDVLEKQNSKIKKWKHIIKSMTKDEIENPEIFDKETSRVSRVAKGSGVNNSDVRSLLKQYKILNEFLKSGETDFSGGLSQQQLQKLAKKFGKKKIRSL